MDHPLYRFLLQVMHRRGQSPSGFARDLGVNHATISRWLSGNTTPSLQSCQKLATCTGVSLERVVTLTGNLALPVVNQRTQWPEFRDYIKENYPEELDDDMIAMIEALITYRKMKREKSD